MLLGMDRITLTDDQRADLRRRTRQPGLAPATRDRLEMVRLADAASSMPQIARHLQIHAQTVRAWIKAFSGGSFDALTNKPRGGDTSELTPAMLEAVRAEVGTGARAWNAAQICAWVAAQYGVRLSPGRMRVHLKRAKLSSQRPARSLKQKPKPEEVAERTAQREELENKGTWA
jgi:transposase